MSSNLFLLIPSINFFSVNNYNVIIIYYITNKLKANLYICISLFLEVMYQRLLSYIKFFFNETQINYAHLILDLL